MKEKIAIITVALVRESVEKSDQKIAQELLKWFKEALAVPWVKSIQKVVVKERVE